jgi:hypothetical protein
MVVKSTNCENKVLLTTNNYLQKCDYKDPLETNISLQIVTEVPFQTNNSLSTVTKKLVFKPAILQEQ